MRIVIINHYAGYPAIGMEFRPYYLAKEWVRMGHEVIVIAASQSHLRKENPVIDYPEVGTPEDDDLKAGWKKMTISADAGERNRYNIQLYLKQGRPDNYDFFKQRSEALDNTWVTYEINNITNEG